MTKINLSIDEILEKIENHQITSEDGLKLIKNLQNQHRIFTNSKGEKGETTLNFHGTCWEKSNPLSKDKGEISGDIIVFDTNTNIYNALIQKYRGNNVRIILVTKGDKYREVEKEIYQINPENKKDYDRLINQFKIKDLKLDKIIHMWSKEDFRETKSKLELQLQNSFYSIFHLTQAIMQSGIEYKIRLMYTYFSDKDVIQPQYAAVSGFNKTLRQENPQFLYKSLELKNSLYLLNESSDKGTEKLTEILVRELENNNHDEFEVRYSNGQRFIKELKELDANTSNKSSIELKDNGTYVILGGTGGLGRIFAKYIGTKINGNLVIVGRSDLDSEKQQFIDELEALGNKVVYEKGDISKSIDVKSLIKRIKTKFKKINGIINTAGIFRNGFIIKKEIKDIKNVLSSKLYGTVNLDNVTKDEELDFFVLFSSLAGEFGKVGQSDYAFANSFLDNFAKYRENLKNKNKRFGKTISINWPHWIEGGMHISQQEEEALFSEGGIKGLPTDKGIEAFEESIQRESNQTIVIYADSDKLKGYINKTKSINSDQTENIDEAQIDIEELTNKTDNFLKKLIGQEIGMSPEELNSKIRFDEYGIDSIVINHFNAKLEKELGQMPKTLLFEHHNVENLTKYLVKNYRDKLIKLFKLGRKKTQKTTFQHDIEWKELTPLSQKYKGKFDIESEKTLKGYINQDIAIIGVGGRYPQGNNLEEFWQNLKDGKDCITEIPKERWDYKKYYDPNYERLKPGKMYSKWGGFVDDIDKFDPLFFSISPREAELMDPQERILLETAWETFENAGYSRKQLSEYVKKEDSANVGVFVGVTSNDYQLIGQDEWNKGSKVIPNARTWSLANRISYILNFDGPSFPVDTACSSSLTAVHLACESLRKSECSLALVGGVNLYVHPSKYISMCQIKMLSPTGRCHTFGKAGDGFVPGEGVGAILLKPLDKAVEDRDYIYGVIKGSALNHGGRTSGYSVPNPNAQAEVILEALRKSDIDPKTISYIEAHGTGTALGDPIEISGLTKVFSQETSETQYCSIGSIKSNIGHLESAAGIAGITKILLQLKYKQLVPTLHCEEINPNINFAETPFYTQNELGEWKQLYKEGHGNIKIPRRAGISSFGAGGANAHVIIEEYENDYIKNISQDQNPQVIVLSAKNEERLRAYVEKMINSLERKLLEEVDINDLAYTLQTGRDEFANRIAFVVSNLEELLEEMKKYLNGNENIEKVYKGQVKKKIFNPYSGDMKEAHKLAKLWVEGEEIQWKELYLNKTPCRIPLSTYPFDKERYWIPEGDNGYTDLREKSIALKLHPFIDINDSTIDGLSYKKTIDDSELNEIGFELEGRQVLVSTLYLEMARAAGELINKKQKIKSLNNIMWIKPILLADDLDDIYVNINQTEEMIKFKVFGTDCNESENIIVTGEFCYQNEMEVKKGKNDISSIKSMCSEIISCDCIYEKLQENGVEYSEDFKVIQEIYIDKNQSLTYVSLTDTYEQKRDNILLEPMIIEAILHMIAVQVEETEAIYVPLFLEELTIYNKLSQELYIHLEELNDSDLHNRKSSFNVEILDESGELLISINNLLVKKALSEDISLFNEDNSLIEMLYMLENGELDIDEADLLTDAFID